MTNIEPQPTIEGLRRSRDVLYKQLKKERQRKEAAEEKVQRLQKLIKTIKPNELKTGDWIVCAVPTDFFELAKKYTLKD